MLKNHLKSMMQDLIWNPRLLIIVILFFCVTNHANPGVEMKFDFSGIDRLWEIVDVLQQDREPSDDLWGKLFQTPGYRELMSHEWYYNERFFKENFRIAFKPALQSEREKQLTGNNRIIQHYRLLIDKKEELLSYRKRLGRPDAVDSALRLMNRYFPQGIVADLDSAPISFIIFDNDARGYDPIVIDLICAFKKGHYADHLFAHEMHHFFRARNLAYDDGSVKAKHEGLFSAINSIQLEGIADQIDKRAAYFKGGDLENDPAAIQYRERVEKSPAVIKEINAILERMADFPSRQNDLGWELKSAIPNSGHPTGYFMTRRIIEELGEKPLVESVGNPFAFYYLYNIAVKDKTQFPSFSNSAIEYLLRIEKEYLREPATHLALQAAHYGLVVSGLTQFWTIVDIIEKGNEPALEQWEALFLNKAYQELEKWEGMKPEVLKKQILNAFDPSQSSPESSGHNHFVLVREQRKTLIELLKSFAAHDPFEAVVKLVESYIPEEYYIDKPKPSFSPVFFSNDLRYGYDTFIIDPVYYLKIGENAARYYGILFTYFHYRKSAFRYHADEVQVRHSRIIGALDQLEHRGVPYLIRYRPLQSLEIAEKPMDIGQSDWDKITTSPDDIRSIDRVLSRIHDNELDMREAGETISDIVSGSLRGGGIGYFMASAIVNELGEGAVKECFANPFAFFALYNKATDMRPDFYPAFSRESVGIIKRLEELYSFD